MRDCIDIGTKNFRALLQRILFSIFKVIASALVLPLIFGFGVLGTGLIKHKNFHFNIFMKELVENFNDLSMVHYAVLLLFPIFLAVYYYDDLRWFMNGVIKIQGGKFEIYRDKKDKLPKYTFSTFEIIAHRNDSSFLKFKNEDGDFLKVEVFDFKNKPELTSNMSSSIKK